MSPSVSVVIPTIGRSELLKNLLDSLFKQSVLPQEVIIIDAGEDLALEGSDFLRTAPIRCVYKKSSVASLTHQKTMGIALARGNWVGFLDDDIVLEEKAFENMVLFLNKNSDRVGGASLNIINASRNYSWMYKIKYLCSLDSHEPGKVLQSGFASQLFPVSHDTKVQWLCGGATFWNRKVFDGVKFDENLKGYSFLEDLDFSYQIGKKYGLYVVASAKAKHVDHHDKSQSWYALGKMQALHRFYFASKHPELSLWCCYFAVHIQMLINVVKKILGYNTSKKYFVFGNFISLVELNWRLITGKVVLSVGIMTQNE